LLKVVVSAADVNDRRGAQLIAQSLQEYGPDLPRLRHIWADSGYDGPALAGWLEEQMGWQLEIVERPPDQNGFQVLPRRWVVERSHAWNGRYRRLSKEYEFRVESSEAFILIGSSYHMLHRLTQPPPKVA